MLIGFNTDKFEILKEFVCHCLFNSAVNFDRFQIKGLLYITGYLSKSRMDNNLL